MPDHPESTARAGTPGRFLYSLPGVLTAVALYALAHTTARLLASGNLGEDDPRESLLIQVLAPGYEVRHGPLYDWALWLLERLLGTGVQPFLVLKYGLLVAMAGFLFAIARRVTGSAMWAFMAVDAMALVYQIFWRFHESLSHVIGTMTLVLASLWALFRLVDRGRPRDYLVFALPVGLGLLSEHSYAVFLFALFAAAALQADVRRRVYARAMLAVPVVAALIASPYVAWLFGEPARRAEFLASLTATDFEAPPVLHALGDAIGFPVLVLAPYIFILPLVFPGVLRTVFRGASAGPAAGPDFGRLLGHLLLFELAWMVLFDAILFPRADYAVQGLLPLFVPALAWLTDRARASAPSAGRIRLFVAIMLALTVVAFAVRAANMYVLDPVCSKCRWGVPYGELAQAMRGAGFRAGTVVIEDEELGGNLRRFFPHARFLVPGRGIPAPAGRPGGQTALVWDVRPGHPEAPAALRAYLPGDAVATPVEVPWHHLWKPTGYRSSRWAMVILDPAPAAVQGSASQ
ncbi:hypothetical protein EZJ19_07505 [Parasulfuritortus cantonensis]|uniref:Glycosyltransferase RgtA/B/C/D-like domain-containing protein n=1 Tax=Parasulfuritortus cantonensis TaxID=2528202 RepID=A0A4R1BDS3_9PROT|nr:glycosyltransferase family 39 protein [Parasulfuritortus cantonensis]TCJ15276.1 hypothetical protein EZJ19_07505 [Parasulfuritortus cantonensis]